MAGCVFNGSTSKSPFFITWANGHIWLTQFKIAVGATLWAPLRAAAFVAYDGAPEGREDGMRGVEHKNCIRASGTIRVREQSRRGIQPGVAPALRVRVRRMRL